MSPQRGQSAIEYMMTYGWGILVVLVAGVLLWQMGYLDLGRNVTPDKRGFSQVTPVDWTLLVNGTLVVVVQNNAGTIVKLAEDTTAAYILNGGSGRCSNVESTVPFDEAFRPGATSKITFYTCNLDSGVSLGEYYRVNLTVGYSNPSSGLPHRSNGVIWGPIG